MKRTLLISSLAATLMAASFTASAQAPAPNANQQVATPRTSYTDPNDPSKGQELVNDANAPVVNPATVGQDKAAGNNLVPETKDAQSMRDAGMEHPDFQTLDVKKQGYLTAADVSTHVWLSTNFARCNTSHDGHLTSEQYSACLK